MNRPNYPLSGPNLDFLPDGTPRPRTADGQPLMTQAEANWHSHVSGVAARETAQAGGADPVACSALLSGAAMIMEGTIDVAGIPMQPLSIGTFLCLERLGSAYAVENATGQPLAIGQMDIARAALVFQRPDWCYLMLEAGDLAAIQKEAVKLSFRMTAPVLREVNAFINAQMAEFFDAPTTEKKSSSPSPEPSPESPEPAGSSAPPEGLSPDGQSP